MAIRQLEFQHAGDPRLADEFEVNGFMALANEKEITESARLFLKIFRVIGDQLHREGQTERIRPHGDETNQDEVQRKLHSAPFSRLQVVINVVDSVLEWLEGCAKNSVICLKKQEMVLRGIFHLTDLGIYQASVFNVLELASSFLDINSDDKFDAYQSHRDFILNCFKDIEEHKEHIQVLVDQACEILKAIIDEENVDKRKGVQFDNIVREAHLEVRACRRRLDCAKKKICELSTKMNAIKWFSRGFRLGGLTISCILLFRELKGSNYFGPLLLGSSVIATGLWMSIYPSNAYKFNALLSTLDLKHSQITDRLDDLRERLSSAKDYKDGLMGIRCSAV